MCRDYVGSQAAVIAIADSQSSSPTPTHTDTHTLTPRPSTNQLLVQQVGKLVSQSLRLASCSAGISMRISRTKSKHAESRQAGKEDARLDLFVQNDFANEIPCWPANVSILSWPGPGLCKQAAQLAPVLGLPAVRVCLCVCVWVCEVCCSSVNVQHLRTWVARNVTSCPGTGFRCEWASTAKCHVQR